MAEVRQAAKHNDPLAGLAAYDKARQAGKPSGSCCAVHVLAVVSAHSLLACLSAAAVRMRRLDSV